MRYVLVEDDDCHWYIIPKDRIKEWYEWFHTEDYELGNCPNWAYSIGGSYTQVEFTDPIINGLSANFENNTLTFI